MEAGRTPAPSPAPRLGRAPTQLTPTMRTQRGAATGTPQIPVPQWGPTTCAHPGRTWAPAAQPHGTPLLSPQGLGDKAAVAQGDKARVAHGDEARVARGGSADGQQPWHCPSPRHTQPPTRPAPSPARRVVPVPAAVSAPWGGGVRAAPAPHIRVWGRGSRTRPCREARPRQTRGCKKFPASAIKNTSGRERAGGGGLGPPSTSLGGLGLPEPLPTLPPSLPSRAGSGDPRGPHSPP